MEAGSEVFEVKYRRSDITRPVIKQRKQLYELTNSGVENIVEAYLI